MSKISTHVLDTSTGKPAAGMPVVLYKQHDDYWDIIAANTTDKDGRITEFADQNGKLLAGVYKLKFDVKDYFKGSAFFPFIEIAFSVSAGEKYHVPLLLSPFGYSTYRGS